MHMEENVLHNDGRNQHPNREMLMELGLEEAIVFESPSYDDAIVGVSNDDRVIYSFEKMIESLVKNDNMTPEDAEDFICYNTLRALPYQPNGPIVLMNEHMFE